MTQGAKLLIVQADDYGACDAFTDGILACFRQRVVTQASVIPTARAAFRSISLALQVGLPLGVHLTAACEWEALRWRPITAAASLTGRDGFLYSGLQEIREHGDRDELHTEFSAQIDSVIQAGSQPTHLDSHIGVVEPAVLSRLSHEHNLPCRDVSVPQSGPLALGSVWHLSLQPYESKVGRLVQHVRSLPPGLHMLVAHPAEDRDELLNLCSQSSPRWKWARDIRVTDTAALTDERFLAACDEAEVQLTSYEALSSSRAPDS